MWEKTGTMEKRRLKLRKGRSLGSKENAGEEEEEVLRKKEDSPWGIEGG